MWQKNNPTDLKLLLVLMLFCKSLLSHILMGKKIRVNFERIFANISQKLWTNPNISPFREALLCILHHEPVEIWSMSLYFNSGQSELQNLGGKIRDFWLVALIVQFSPPLPMLWQIHTFPQGFPYFCSMDYHRVPYGRNVPLWRIHTFPQQYPNVPARLPLRQTGNCP